MLDLRDYQLEAVKKLQNGNILCGGVGSGKSRTALAYYYKEQGGNIYADDYIPMDDEVIQDLYIITTARKRDTLEWEGELVPFLLSPQKEFNLYRNTVVIDSWNNIKKYVDVKNAFFIFDEQRVVGSGVWVKSFYKIAKNNNWILLSATPGDTWQDYIPVFVANGFYKNKSEFIREHVIYDRFSKFPKVDRYVNQGRLIRQRNAILVRMNYNRTTMAHHEDVYSSYDVLKYKEIVRTRKNPLTGEPIKTAGEFCNLLRRVSITDTSRKMKMLELLEEHPKAIVFYNFDYELALLKQLCTESGITFAEWNGHLHQPIPSGEMWVYLVQYSAGAEGWNCTTTDTIIFYSDNYSYRIMTQAAGRIDRLNTPYLDLWYFHLKSRSGIDLRISKTLNEKKDFNIRGFASSFKFYAGG